MHLLSKLTPCTLALLLPLAASSQTADLCVGHGANLYIFGNAAIYGNVENRGNIGTDAATTVIFYGNTWKNTSGSAFPIMSGVGGTIRFIQPRPAPYANSVTQNLDGGYASGAEPSFPNLEISNTNNLSQATTNTRVRNNLNFTTGKILLNNTDLVLGSTGGSGGTGTITNYDQNRFVITNNTAGHLVKEPYSGAYIFPIGMSTADYTPASINNTVANGMHANVTNYASSAAPRTGTNGIDRTWNIYADNATGSSTINLQHNSASAQASFNTGAQFVARYVGTTPNTAGDLSSTDAWERNNPGAGSSTGTLTTGAAIANASERSRAYTSFATSAVSNSAYYTKASETQFCLNLRVYLEGALMNNGNAVASDGRPLMRDNLRNSPFTSTNYIPSLDPYEFATANVNVTSKYIKLAPQNNTYPQFQQVSSPNVFTVTGQNAIVDWTFVELRNKSNNTQVQATRAALLQRDGDIVDVDGVSCLSFPGVTVDSYFVAVRHRSHLGTMTKYGQSATNLQTLVDFTIASTPLYDKGVVGFNDFTGLSQKANVKGIYRAMWQGDFNADRKIKYDSPNDDLTEMLFDVLLHPNNVNGTTNYDFAFGYYQGDFNMNGKVKFDSPNDDNSDLLFQVLLYTANQNGTTNYDFVIQQFP